MRKQFNIKTRLMASVLGLTTLIVLGLTLATYQQHNQSQIEKIISQANAIISPFHELLRKEIPSHSLNQSLYLKVALRAKQDTQVPQLFKTYQTLKGLRFISTDGSDFMRIGDPGKVDISYQKPYISDQKIHILIPFKKNGQHLGDSLLTFSSQAFYQRQNQILLTGATFLILFLGIGFVGAKIVGVSIAGPIEVLASHLKNEQLENIPLLDRGDEVGEFSRTIHDLALTLKKRENELKSIAFFDALTNLPNRTLFLDRLNQMLFHSERDHTNLAILFIDLNGFKHVNDTYGHAAGDELLRQVAQRMLKEKRKTDTLARISGDEFTLALYNPSSSQVVSKYCENLLQVFKNPFLLSNRETFISASIGVSFYPGNGSSAEALLNNADKAMYFSKTFGGNQYRFYSKELHQNDAERLTLESDLWRAIELAHIELHYQPRVSLNDGKLLGIEALARWTHPTQGNIPPLKFISLAEQTGLIKPLGQLVMHKACLQMKAWVDMGLVDVQMAINLSPQQLNDKDLLSSIKSILNETKLPAAALEFELTETAIMRQPEHGINVMNAIHELGIEISIDDFGTGYSSLNRLQQFPLSTLKIDRSFINDLVVNENSQSIVKAIISMAHALGMNTIAEGVEVKEQADLLLSFGAVEAQGYYFSRPLSADLFEKYAGLTINNSRVQNNLTNINEPTRSHGATKTLTSNIDTFSS